MAGPHHQVTGNRLYSERIRLPFGGKPVVKVFRDEEGRYYTDYPLLNGRFASYKQIGDRIRELRNLLEFRIEQPVVMQPQAQGPAVMPPRSQLRPPASEKLMAGAAEIASAAALKEPVFSSLEGCLTTMSPEGLITTSPGTASHDTGSSTFSAFRCEMSVTGAAEFAFGQGLQDPYFASSKNLLDTTPLEESITAVPAVPQSAPHNAIDSSPSTFPSCSEKFVAGTAESLPAPQDLHGSSLDKFVDKFTTTNGFQHSASSIGSCEELMTASSGTASHSTRLSSFSIFSCEKFVAGAAEFASGKALQDKHFASPKELPDTKSLEESITAVPQTMPHKTIDGSPSTLQSSCEKFVSGAAETIPALQDRDEYLDKILDEIFYSSSVETISAVPKTVPHNTIDGSPSTLQSSCGKLVSGSAKTIPALRKQHVSFLSRITDEFISKLIDSSSEESTTASTWTVPHSAANGCQQPASSIGIIETEDDGDHCYGCRNNRDPMQQPKNTNAHTGLRFGDCPGVILSDYDDDDDFDDYDEDSGDCIADDDDDDVREDEEVDGVVEDGKNNVGHARPRIMLDASV